VTDCYSTSFHNHLLFGAFGFRTPFIDSSVEKSLNRTIKIEEPKTIKKFNPFRKTESKQPVRKKRLKGAPVNDVVMPLWAHKVLLFLSFLLFFFFKKYV
jgi:hypothetical protein